MFGDIGDIFKYNLVSFKRHTVELGGNSRVEAHFEDAPNCQTQERCDVVSDKNNRFCSLRTESICCKMECLQNNREISTSFKISKGVVVKLIPITHRY